MITIEEKIKLIKDLAEKHDISAYEIGLNSEVSTSSAHKIFSGEQKNPRNKTLNLILEYIENKITGSNNSEKKLKKEYYIENRKPMLSSETEADYNEFSNLKIDDKLNLIYQLLKKIDDRLE